MSTIALWPFHEIGHILPTLKLARGLRAAGHRVVYLTLSDFQDLVRGCGFEARAVLTDSIPPGAIDRLHRAPPELHEELSEALIDTCQQAVLSGEIADAVLGLAPDVLLCDTLLFGLAMAARGWGIPCFRLSTALPHAAAPGVPPLTTALPYGDTPERRAAADAAWDRCVDESCAGERGEEFRALVAALAERCDYPPDQIDWRAVFRPELRAIPEIVLCPPGLDYPRPAGELLHHAESIDLERSGLERSGLARSGLARSGGGGVPGAGAGAGGAAGFPWDRVDGRPLVYCSLGTQTYRIPGAQRFYRELVTAAAARPAWQLVIALGTRLRRQDLGDVPDDVVTAPFAPQIELLGRARLAITHGGLGTIKESVALGVPMLVVPLLFDQPGNAARVAHHGLGEVTDFHQAAAPALAATVDRLLADEALRARVRDKQRAVLAFEASRPGVAVVEAALG